MTRKQEVDKKSIKSYWENKSPQIWYSDKERESKEWFNELERKRYEIYYECIKEVGEFENHSGEKVLDIGVGVGTELVQYAKNGAKVSGIDLTTESIRLTKRNFEVNGLEYESLRTADAESLPFPDNTFDLVTSYGVLHHTPNTDKAIKEVHRVLKPYGKTIMLLYARGIKHYVKRIGIHGILLGELFTKGYDKLINDQTEVHGNSPLTYVYTKRELEEMFNMFGEMEIRRHHLGEYIDYAPYQTKKVPDFVKRSLYALDIHRLIGEDFIIKAEKREKKERPSFLSTLLKP